MDLDEAKRREEEERRRAEEEKRQLMEEEGMRKSAELAAMEEKLERVQKMADEQIAIALAKHQLEAKKEALSKAQMAARINIDDDDNDRSSDSTPEEQQVHNIIISLLY